MSDSQINENEIREELSKLLEKQNRFEEKITELSRELEKVRRSLSIQPLESAPKPEDITTSNTDNVKIPVSETPQENPVNQPLEKITVPQTDFLSFAEKQKAYFASQKKKKLIQSSEIEKYIGENLTNKIGILITIIGVAIGAKYAIDHQLISPLMRILLGYLIGIVLFGFAIRLKKEYNSFSAVLMSGAMAIVYFITYAAFSFYALMPQYVAFGLMVMITATTVYASIKYDRQVIGHIGMVGAYGVPFLLSDGSGNMVVLFSYMSIINLGIMALAFKKYWKPIYYFSFGLSWLIYFAWYESSYKDIIHFYNAFLFLSVFYLTFYVTYLSYNLIRKELFNRKDVILILINSFIFYGIGYALLVGHPEGKLYLGLFTLITAIIHALVCGLIYKMKLADWHLFYFISALALTFITIAVPVQLSGNWITLLWVGEAGLLFWIGRVKQISMYETISYAMMIMATFSMIGDWNLGYLNTSSVETGFRILPVANIYFVTSLLFVAVFAFINLLNRNKSYPSTVNRNDFFFNLMMLLIPGILIGALYFMFWMEIDHYCSVLINTFEVGANGTVDPLNLIQYQNLKNIRLLWLINYSLLFFACLSVFNIKVLKNKLLGYINLVINLLVLIIFLTSGLYSLSELRESFLNQTLSAGFYHPGAFNFYFRYISFIFVVPMLMICYHYVRQEFIEVKLDKAYSLILHTVILWILSSELITWIDFFRGDQAYKLGLSLLWGGYALLLIVLGIWKNRQHIRIGAIVLFSATLLKLFFYDLQDMGTIARTIVFVTLGILLLIISFLYNKYKHVLWDV